MKAGVTGGDKLAGVLETIARKLRPSDRPRVKVGFLRDATYPDGTSVALVAGINEFGAPSRGQPPRPFFRNMIAQHSKEWPQQVGNVLKRQKYDAVKTLALMGDGIGGDLQQSIIDLTTPPLKQSTIDEKDSAKPLVETGDMLNSVAWEVEAGNGGARGKLPSISVKRARGGK